MSRIETWWAGARDSLWYIPALLTSLAFVLALATVELDRRLVVAGKADAGWILGGGAEGARGVLTTISGGIITVAGVVFSVTIVALQLASTQFTPRVLHHFMADRISQWVLGVFIGTFTYALLIQRTIRGGTEAGGEFIPAVSITVATVFALVSICFLILFINHMARSIQAAVIISGVTRETLDEVEALFPEPYGELSAVETAVPATPPAVIRSRDSGYLQTVDEHALLQIGAGPLIAQVDAKIGEFVLPGTSLVSVWPAAAVDGKLGNEVRNAVVLGPERTPYQDVEFGVVQLTDIAVKALSPAINDPTTATHCIDRLAEILLVIGQRELARPIRRSPHGRVQLFAQPGSFERLVSLAFDRIRYYARSDATVLRRLLDVIGRIAGLLPEDRRPPLARQVAAILRQAEHGVTEVIDLERVRRSGEWARERTAVHPQQSAA